MADTKPKTFEDNPVAPAPSDKPKTFVEDANKAKDKPENLPAQNASDTDNPAASDSSIAPGDSAAHEGVAEDTHPLATGIQDGKAGETEQEEAERVAGHNERVLREKAERFDTRSGVAESKRALGGISPKTDALNTQRQVNEANREAERELRDGGPPNR